MRTDRLEALERGLKQWYRSNIREMFLSTDEWFSIKVVSKYKQKTVIVTNLIDDIKSFGDGWTFTGATLEEAFDDAFKSFEIPFNVNSDEPMKCVNNLCDSENITALPFETDGGYAWRRVNCEECGETWIENFVFQDWEHDD